MLVNKHQANTEVKNAEGLTPLHFSIVENRLKSVIALLYVGANPDTKAGKGDSPLHLAVKVGDLAYNLNYLDMCNCVIGWLCELGPCFDCVWS